MNKNTPFDQKFHILLNVAVGGNNGYFPDDMCDKPWNNFDNRPSPNDFWDNKQQWLPSWNLGSDDAAMKIKSVQAWEKTESTPTTSDL
jgi:hypothetical protein